MRMSATCDFYPSLDTQRQFEKVTYAAVATILPMLPDPVYAPTALPSLHNF